MSNQNKEAERVTAWYHTDKLLEDAKTGLWKDQDLKALRISKGKARRAAVVFNALGDTEQTADARAIYARFSTREAELRIMCLLNETMHKVQTILDEVDTQVMPVDHSVHDTVLSIHAAARRLSGTG